MSVLTFQDVLNVFKGKALSFRSKASWHRKEPVH